MAVQDKYALLSRLARAANATNLPFPSRLKTLVSILQQNLPVLAASVYLPDPERSRLACRIASPGPSGMSSCKIPFGAGVAGEAAEKQSSVLRGVDKRHPDETAPPGACMIAAYPVIDNGCLCGILALAVEHEGGVDSAFLRLIDDTLVLVAGLVQGVRLMNESGRQVRNLTTLSELGQLLNRATTPEALIPLIVQTCYRHDEVCGVILRLEEGNGLPSGTYKKFQRRFLSTAATLLAIGLQESQRVTAGESPVVIRDLGPGEETPPSCISVPLRFEHRHIGVLTIFGKVGPKGARSNFDENDRDLFQSVSTLISNSLIGVAHYQQTLSLSIENDMKLKELSLLYRVSNTMLSTIRLNKLIHLILTALTSRVAPCFDRAMLFLINEKSRTMQGMLGVTQETATGLISPVAELNDLVANRWDISEQDMIRQRDSEFSAKVRASRLPLNKSLNLSSRAVLDRRLIYVPDASRERRVDHEFVKRFGITSFAAAPLMARQKVVGVVVVDNAIHGRPIGNDELRFLQLFTNQAGIAIENSVLYNRVEDANRSLREAQERLIQGERLATIGEMAAGIAHELKGPLVSIGGFARRLQKRLTPDSGEREHAETIVREVQRLEKMLSDILNFTRKTTICFSNCSIIEIIEDSLVIAGQALEESGVRIMKEYPRRSFTLLGDCQQLKQVFLNLFFNAQEAMKQGGDLRIVVCSGRISGKPAVIVRVSDTGGGVPLQVLANIFNPFYTTKESGTGLGLPIANRIVTNHGGKIQVDNRPGEGATFTVVLPLGQ